MMDTAMMRATAAGARLAGDYSKCIESLVEALFRHASGFVAPVLITADQGNDIKQDHAKIELLRQRMNCHDNYQTVINDYSLSGA